TIENIEIGLYNDSEFLYLMMDIKNYSIVSQIKTNGFILWFDPQFNKEKKLGICYPLGTMRIGGKERGAGNQSGEDKGEDPQQLKASLSELEIYKGEGESIKRITLSKAKGIEISADLRRDRLVYELKIPLIWSDKHPYSIGVIEDKPIDIGFETMYDEKTSKTGSGFSVSGGPQGRMSRGSFYRSGTNQYMSQEKTELFKHWIVVQLASEKTAKTVMTKE
ncbi:hypothetical protein KKB18_13635, partial [bacterium]|nr:hypothetical protein [bacterium]